MASRSVQRRGWLLAVFNLGVTLLLVGETRGAVILTTSASRGVLAAATDAGPPAGGAHLSTAEGLFDHDVTGDGMSLAGHIVASASQGSFTPDLVGPVMSGAGAVSAWADATGATGFSVLAHSYFDVFFEVSDTGFYGFSASVAWAGATPPFGGVSLVELINDDDSLTLHKVTKGPGDPPGADTFSGDVLLVAGVKYRLHAEAKIEGGFDVGGLYEAGGLWDFRLAGETSIPEPANLAIWGFGAVVGLARSITRRRRDGALA